MTYPEAESFLFNELQSFQDKGRVAYNGTLDNAITLSKLLGDPHKKFKSIHIGGTNGKGSVSHMIAAGLQANGYKVGLYTSPHYKSYRERIKINGELIPEVEVSTFIEKYKAEIVKIKPSFFEITCAMAFDHFARHKVDVAVVEVGLGGRLDSTNIIQPLISVVTNISFDHQNILGNTLIAIAGEKAGIIKSKTPIVIGETQEEIRHVFENKALEKGSEIYFADEESSIKIVGLPQNNRFNFDPGFDDWNIPLETHLSSPYQLKNLTTALYTLFQLKNKLHLDISKIANGIKNINSLTYFIGRWSIIQESPKVIFDSAHNLSGVRYIVDEIKKMNYDSLKIIWGSTKEKDIDQILSILPKKATYYFCQAKNSRALDAELLRTNAATFGLEGYAYATVRAAYRVALAESNTADLILVAGSTFVIAELV
jgi:dihydrofolate synthase/folylpolyglutamate synthase